MTRDMIQHESIDCTDMKALLSAYIDDEMDGPTRHLAERHLADCEQCRALVNEAEGLDGLIALDSHERATTARLPESFVDEVLARTAYAQPPREGSRWAMWTGWFAAAACLALAAALWWTDIPAPRDREQVAQNEPIENERETEPPSRADGRAENTVSGAANAPVARPATYTTGLDLQSDTYDGTLPAESFRLASHVRLRPAVTTRTLVPRTDAEAMSEPPAQDDRSASEPLAIEDSETLYSTALLLDLLVDADLSSFSEIEWMRRVIETDELLSHLHTARDRVAMADRPAVFAAESIIVRIAEGPLEIEDVERLQEIATEMDLAGELTRISRLAPGVPPI